MQRGKKSELLQENTGLRSENEELKNKLAQMEALIRSLQGSQDTTTSAQPQDGDVETKDKEEEVVTVTFQAHHMFRDESDLSVGLVIDGVSVKRKKKRSRKAKKKSGKKKPHKLRRKRKQKPRDKKGKNARKKEEGRSISFTATTTLPDEVLGASEFTEKKTEDMKKMVYNKLKELAVNLKKVSTEETVEKLLQGELAKGKRSAFYLVNLGTLADKFAEWQRLLPRIQPHYAMKCNPDLALVQTLQLLGTGFDCASKKELEVAFAAGASPEQIIFANPCKQEEHIEYAKQMNVKLMTFDSKEELAKILPRFPEAELVLRILPDDSNSLMPFGTKFGANREEISELLELCKASNANLVGVSFHVGSGCYAVDAFTDAIRLARSVFDEAELVGFNLKLLDIGGGFPGISTVTSTLYDSSDSESEDSSRGYESGSGGGNEISPQISFEEIAMAIGPLIDELFPSHVRVISEPGRFFVTAAATLAVNVVCRRERVRGYLKENRIMGGIGSSGGMPTMSNGDDAAVIEQVEADEMSAGSGDESSSGMEAADAQLTKEVLYYLSDGIYGSFNNIIFDHATPLPALLSPAPERVGPPVKRERSCLFGPTCDSIDVICKNVALPRLNVGDWLYFVNMGAYTTASASNFNGIAMPEYHYIIAMRDPSDDDNSADPIDKKDSLPFPPAPSIIDIIK